LRGVGPPLVTPPAGVETSKKGYTDQQTGEKVSWEKGKEIPQTGGWEREMFGQG